MANVEQIELKRLIRSPYHPRRITTSQFDALKKSLLTDPQFFERRPCLVNKRDGQLPGFAASI